MVIEKPTDESKERRFLKDCELRVAEPGGDSKSPGTLTGYAAVFDSLSEKLVTELGYPFYERVAAGAFAESLKRGDDVRAFIEHEGGLSTLGRTTAGTLALKEDSHGLQATIVLPNTQAGRDLTDLITRGDLSQMSFGFKTPVGGDEWFAGRHDGIDERLLKRVGLFDVSVVALPAYPVTDVQVANRSRATWVEQRSVRLATVQARWKEKHLTQAKRRLRLGQ